MTVAIVVGAGVVGASAAWRLASRGVDVTVLDQFPEGHTKGSSHGSSRIFRLAYPEPTYVRLAQQAKRLWEELEEVSGRRLLSLTGAIDHGDPAVLGELRAAMHAAGATSMELSSAAAEERWPALHFETTVLFHPDGGRLFADDALVALAGAAVSRGAVVRRDVQVATVGVRPDGRAEVISAEGEVFIGDVVVVAAGGWAPTLLAELPMPPLRVTQEQTVHLRMIDPTLDWPSFIQHPEHGDGRSLGVSPAPNGVYGLGDTGADGSEGVKVGFHAVGREVDPDHRDRTPDGALHAALQHYAERWMPGADAGSAESSTCLYTQTPDHHFVIDRAGPIVVAAGFSGHGFKFGPALGQLIAGLALDGMDTPRLFGFRSL